MTDSKRSVVAAAGSARHGAGRQLRASRQGRSGDRNSGRTRGDRRAAARTAAPGALG